MDIIRLGKIPLYFSFIDSMNQWNFTTITKLKEIAMEWGIGYCGSHSP